MTMLRSLLAALPAVLLFRPLAALADGCARASQASVVHPTGSTVVEWGSPVLIAAVLGLALLRNRKG